MRSERIKKLTYTGMFAALIFLAVYVLRIPMPSNGSYIHLGDAVMYLAAAMLPLPYAIAASVIGAGLADALVPGGMLWLPFTMVIKALCCLAFSHGKGPLFAKRNFLAVLLASGITLVGYSAAAAIMFGGLGAALAELPVSLIQSAAAAICFAVVAKALDKLMKGKTLLSH